MYPDVADLREFYDGELGGLARRLIRAPLRKLWDNVAGLSILGLGYATPYMRPFMGEAQRLFACMPAPQGVTWWPREGLNATTLTEETTLPLADNSIDRLLVVHALENTQNLKALLEECWRVLAGNGRMVVIVPHRGGFWNSSKIPFGHGFSFSHGHIRRLLADNRFQVERQARALFMPPFLHKFLGGSADWIERNGARFLPALAGVLLVEATKQLYVRPTTQKVRTAKPVLIPIPDFVTPSPTATRTR